MSTFCALVNIQKYGLLSQLVTISAGATVRTRTVLTDLLAATPITRALVDVLVCSIAEYFDELCRKSKADR